MKEKEAFFNELSMRPLCTSKEEVQSRMDRFVETVKGTIKTGVKRIRYEHGLEGVKLTEDLSLQQYCLEKGNKTRGDFLFSCVRKPYLGKEDTAYEKYTTSYDNVKLIKNNKSKVECLGGLYCAHLMESFCIGFQSESFWENIFFDLELEKQGKVTKASIACISNPADFDSPLFINWIIRLWGDSFLELKKSFKQPKDKSIHLSDDHGKNILNNFAKRLVNEPYIEEILDSIPYQPHEKECIHRIYPDGTIEFVLTDTDKGLGLIIKTTAKTLLEATVAASYLKNKYG
jgi:hypothetical protein